MNMHSLYCCYMLKYITKIQSVIFIFLIYKKNEIEIYVVII